MLVTKARLQRCSHARIPWRSLRIPSTPSGDTEPREPLRAGDLERRQGRSHSSRARSISSFKCSLFRLCFILSNLFSFISHDLTSCYCDSFVVVLANGIAKGNVREQINHLMWKTPCVCNEHARNKEMEKMQNKESDCNINNIKVRRESQTNFASQTVRSFSQEYYPA